MLLTDLVYPLFPIRSGKLYIKDGIDYIDTGKSVWQVDNKNLQGKTLVDRRFGIPRKERYPLTLSIFNISQLLNYKKGNRFIDSLGVIFKYRRTRYESLKYHKVIGKKEIDESTYALFIEERSNPIYVSKGLFDSVYEYKEPLYIGLLSYHGGFLLYELSKEKKKTTRRMV